MRGSGINQKAYIAARETDPEKYRSQLNGLRFQEEIEAAYLVFNRPNFLLGLRIGALFSILINICFFFVDRQIDALNPHLGWLNVWRFAIAIPFFAITLAGSFAIKSDRALNYLAYAGVTGGSILVMALMVPAPSSVNDYYWASLNIVVLYPFILMNMCYRFALASGVSVLAVFIIGANSVVSMSHGGFLTAMGVLAIAFGVGVVGGYILERFKRSDFLQRYLAQQAVNNLQRTNMKLESLSHIDPLTDIPNRRFFDTNFEKEWARCRRDKLPISLLIVDIDRFKLYNDSYGHPAGDHVLKQVAKCLKKAVRRPADFVARYGGEEFAVVLADTDESGVTRTAERILEGVRDLHISHDCREAGEEPYVTVSIGASCMIPAKNNNLDLLIELADKALYEAKRGGRNRLVKKDSREPSVTP